MGHLRVFFNTNIQRTEERRFSLLGGAFTDIGNFFLTPVRFFLQGKTLRLRIGMPKVTSFYHEDVDYEPTNVPKVSKQDDNLNSTNWKNWPIPSPIVYIGAALSFIPGVILGSIFKFISYADPSVRWSHGFVNRKLRLQEEVFIGTAENPVSKLAEALKMQRAVGQKTGKLVIYAHDKVLNEECLKLISDINPREVVLIGAQGDWRLEEKVAVRNVIRSARNHSKWKKWDLRELGVDVQNEKRPRVEKQEPVPGEKILIELVGRGPRKRVDYIPSPRVDPETLLGQSSALFKQPKKHVVHVRENKDAPAITRSPNAQ